MKKKNYMVPHAFINHAEPINIIAMSLNKETVEWNDDVELEAKEDNQWADIWQ